MQDWLCPQKQVSEASFARQSQEAIPITIYFIHPRGKLKIKLKVPVSRRSQSHVPTSGRSVLLVVLLVPLVLQQTTQRCKTKQKGHDRPLGCCCHCQVFVSTRGKKQNTALNKLLVHLLMQTDSWVYRDDSC